MATDLEIINSALTKLGAGLITSAQKTGGTTKEARLAVERLPHLRKAMLRSHPWNAAIRRTEISPLYTSITADGETLLLSNSSSDTWYWGVPLVGDHIYTEEWTTSAGNDITGWIYKRSNVIHALNEGWDGRGWDINVMQSPPRGGWVSQSPASPTTFFTDPKVSYSGDIWDNRYGSLAQQFMNPNVLSPPVDVSVLRSDAQYGFKYRIKLPSDCIRLLPLPNSPDGNYRVEDGHIFIDKSAPELLYISDLPITFFDPSMAETLAFSLALDMSYAITQSQGITDMLTKQHARSLSLAKTQDAQEDGRYYLEANLFDESRYGNSIFTDYRNHYRP
jgi:hypothetical protein